MHLSKFMGLQSTGTQFHTTDNKSLEQKPGAFGYIIGGTCLGKFFLVSVNEQRKISC